MCSSLTHTSQYTVLLAFLALAPAALAGPAAAAAPLQARAAAAAPVEGSLENLVSSLFPIIIILTHR